MQRKGTTNPQNKRLKQCCFQNTQIVAKIWKQRKTKKEQMTRHYFVAKRLGVDNFHVPNTSCKI